MIITRHNYEEYFILYMDNELDNEDRRQVELFVRENPDLKTELELLLQSQLMPDTTLVFTNKESLLRQADPPASINDANYEEWLLLFTDNELTPDQRKTVEQFVNTHPAIKAELEILQKTKLHPETIIFPDKESLYRKEEKVKVVAVYWRRVAVAAALLLAVSSTALFVLNKNDKPTGIVATRPEEKKTSPVIGGDKLVNNKQSVVENNPVADNDIIYENTIPSGAAVAEQKLSEEKEKGKKTLPVEARQKETVTVAEKEEKKKNNDLPQPLYNPNVKSVTGQNQIAQVEIPVKPVLTDPKETNTTPTVTPDRPQPLDNVIAASSKESVDPIDDEQPGRKNKLRGFFRKVTRTFEKNTNIKATDDDDRLLVGGLAIKL